MLCDTLYHSNANQSTQFVKWKWQNRWKSIIHFIFGSEKSLFFISFLCFNKFLSKSAFDGVDCEILSTRNNDGKYDFPISIARSLNKQIERLLVKRQSKNRQWTVKSYRFFGHEINQILPQSKKREKNGFDLYRSRKANHLWCKRTCNKSRLHRNDPCHTPVKLIEQRNRRRPEQQQDQNQMITKWKIVCLFRMATETEHEQPKTFWQFSKWKVRFDICQHWFASHHFGSSVRKWNDNFWRDTTLCDNNLFRLYFVSQWKCCFDNFIDFWFQFVADNSIYPVAIVNKPKLTMEMKASKSENFHSFFCFNFFHFSLRWFSSSSTLSKFKSIKFSRKLVHCLLITSLNSIVSFLEAIFALNSDLQNHKKNWTNKKHSRFSFINAEVRKWKTGKSEKAKQNV